MISLARQALFGSYGEEAGRLAASVGASLVGVVVWGGVGTPVATVSDVTSIVIYFSVARALLGGGTA